MHYAHLNEFHKIENVINSEELLNQKYNLSEQKYLQLLSYLNILFSFEDLYVCKEKNGDIRPIYFINHYPNTDYFELT